MALTGFLAVLRHTCLGPATAQNVSSLTWPSLLNLSAAFEHSPAPLSPDVPMTVGGRPHTAELLSRSSRLECFMKTLIQFSVTPHFSAGMRASPWRDHEQRHPLRCDSLHRLQDVREGLRRTARPSL